MPVQPDPAGRVTATAGDHPPSGGQLDPTLGRATLIARFGGDTEFFNEVAAVFLDDCPRLLDQLRAACARQDLAALRATAHAFKGAISHFTNGEAYAAVAALERAAEAGHDNAFPESHRVEGVIAAFAAALAAARSQ
jgi:HPt (histidine-containing phosphotransfer) domain-containing protein